MLVDDVLKGLVDLFASGKQFIEGGLAEDRPQRGLRDLRGGVDVVQDLGHRPSRVDDLEVDDRVDLGGHVVVRDHLLRRHLERDRALVDLDQAVDAERDDEEESRAFEGDQPPQPEDNPTLVFVGDADAGEDGDEHDE